MAVTWLKLAYEQDVVTKALFDAQTILAATVDNTPVALTVNEQTLVGRLTGGDVAAISIGIVDNNIVQIDHASVADNDYAKFTANGLEGRSSSEVLGDLSGQAAAAFDWDGQQSHNIVIHNVADQTAKLALTPILGKIVFQVDELAFYGCKVIA